MLLRYKLSKRVPIRTSFRSGMVDSDALFPCVFRRTPLVEGGSNGSISEERNSSWEFVGNGERVL